ncbi:MAG: sugar ABC transporter ATP-binding protein [Anaerolineae bacterium]|nr:sugar ABC transporter ATP-binding protein [Anaerolineae bacterium]MCO5187037.1 sugar ABC transporter ATP-binding protein [Anaerolineae bacterium]MCO5196085.1 sugar ABC transporter ATP-binding protein [Anaerolineae bacterium]
MTTAEQPILEVRGITKRFPGVVALNNVSAQFMPGEVHAVVGENGAGKSTLMKVMVGAYRPDGGEIIFRGEKVAFAHPKEAQEAGISIIYQEFNLLPDRTVAQNVFFGREPSRYGLVNQRELNQKTVEVLRELGAENMFQPTAPLHTLSVAEQQIVEIAKAIAFDSKVLIMDEPTAALSMTEVQLLTDLIDKLLERNLAIVFISHRFREVFDLSQKISVLKDGQYIGTLKTAETDANEVIEMMVGRPLDSYFPGLATPEEIGAVKVSVRNGSNDFLKNINLDLCAGEIVGVSGLQGSGRTELAQALFGVEPFHEGTVAINGKALQVNSPTIAIRNKMGFVTEDRKAEGIFPNQPIRDNILLTVRTLQALVKRISRDGVTGQPNLVSDLSHQVDVRASSSDQEVQYLSGGNQQKVVLAKWLASTAEIFIFDEPTRGIDVEAKAAIHEMIRELARRGAAILMISSELPEIIGMSDRIIVMWDGTIYGELPSGATESEIMKLATGHSNGNANGSNSE